MVRGQQRLLATHLLNDYIFNLLFKTFPLFNSRSNINVLPLCCTKNGVSVNRYSIT